MKYKTKFGISIIFLLLFIIWTVAVNFVDVGTVGPNGASVGFTTINIFLHNIFGVNMSLYTITDWLGLIPIGIMLIFATIGLIQWIKRKSLLKVDFDILMLGMFYILLMGVYLFFECIVINYRPVLIDGFLEASYPSSTTMLVLCVVGVTILQINARIKCKTLKRILILLSSSFICFMVIGRLISGVHWFSDIVGGGFISISLIEFYCYITSFKKHRLKN